MAGKVNPGQKAKPSASLRNTSIDVADHWDRKGPWKDAPPDHTPRNYSKVKVKNNTGSDLRRGEVVELNGGILTDIEPDYPWFSGVDVDLTHVGWGITLNPIKSTEIDNVLLVGCCPAWVNIKDESHRYADRAAGETVLQSQTTPGPVKLLHIPTGSTPPDERECWVQIGGEGGSASDIVFFALTTPLRLSENEPNYAFAGTLHLDSGLMDETDDSQEIVVYDPYKIPEEQRGQWNGYEGYRGWAIRRTEDHEGNGVNAIVRLTIPADWWADSGTITLEIDGDSTGSIAFPNTDFPQTLTAFLGNLATGITAAIGSGQASVRTIYSHADLSPVVEIEFIDTYANMPITVTVDAWTHTTSVASPSISSVQTGSNSSFTLPAYNIIWMERPAQWMDFIAGEYMGEHTTGQIAVQSPGGLVRYDDQGASPNTAYGAVVYDPDGTFGDVITGCTGHAVYNNYSERYELKSSERMAKEAYASLSETTCADPEESADAEVTISSFNIIATGEHVGDPSADPTIATNRLFIPGRNGDKVLLRRTSNAIAFAAGVPNYGFVWEIVNLAPHEYQMVSNVVIDGVLKQQVILVKVWTCEGSLTDETIATITECP